MPGVGGRNKGNGKDETDGTGETDYAGGENNWNTRDKKGMRDGTREMRSEKAGKKNDLKRRRDNDTKQSSC